jgi:peptidoglycan/LPS O-acetylase OafA/YrhL
LLGAGLQFTLINAFFAGILLLFLLAGTGTARRYVNLSGFRFLGYLSYGLYLDHLLAFRIYDWIYARYFPPLAVPVSDFARVFLRFALAGSGAITAAYLSRKYFEERFLRLKDSLVPQTRPSGETISTTNQLGATEAA